MSLLHATWLPAIRTPSSSGRAALLVWADTWRVADPLGPGAPSRAGSSSPGASEVCGAGTTMDRERPERAAE